MSIIVIYHVINVKTEPFEGRLQQIRRTKAANITRDDITCAARRQ